jgi:capsular exopolysaccharide synthesis family protein
VFGTRSAAESIDPRLVTITTPKSFEAEQYRRLRQHVESFSEERGTRVIAVTSAVVGDGKTITAINLATILARKLDRKVLLIDADLRRPMVATRLGLPPSDFGLMTALHASKRPLSDFVTQIPGTALSVLPGGMAGAEAYELLTSPRLEVLLREARAEYDFVILDTPPLVPVPDSGLLKKVIDGYIIVVGANSTPRKLLGEALGMLEPTQVMGLVWNRDEQRTLNSYYSHYRLSLRVSPNGNGNGNGKA